MGLTITKKTVKEWNPVPKKAGEFERIMSLPASKRVVIDKMLQDGKSAAKVVDTLKKGWGLFPDVSDSAMKKYIQRYKWQAIDRPKKHDVPSFAPQVNVLLNKLQYTVDELEPMKEIVDLVVLQKTRIRKVMEKEEGMPLLFNTLRYEIKVLAELLKQYTDLSFDLGYMKRVPNITKISANGAVMTIESDAKDKLQEELKNKQQMSFVANQFMELLNEIPAEIKDITDESDDEEAATD